ncbi:MAG: ABC transporter permease [Terracidiphilus sp.]
MRWWQIRKRDADLERELRSDLDLEEDEQRENGLPPNEARYAAKRAFGNPTLIREQTHEAWGWAPFERFWQDVRYALRQMRKSPRFATVAVLTLALAIGANASVFSVLDAVLLRPLEFPNADRLVEITSLKDGKPVGTSAPDVKDFAAQSRTFEKIAVYDEWRKNVSASPGGDNAQELMVGLAPLELFEAFGVQPLLGRLFTPEEGLAGRNHVTLITEGFWRTRFQRDPKILGRTLTINDQPYTIIGVIPDVIPGWINASYNQLRGLSLWEPFLPMADVWSEQSRSGRGFGTIGLLKPGVTRDMAQADLATIAHNLAVSYPADQDMGVDVIPLENMRSGDLKPLLLVLMGAVGLILLIACSNLAALLLARNTARQREFAMRKALGAGRAALVRQVVAEMLVLSVMGSGLGLGMAWGTTRALRISDPGHLPQLLELTLDWRVMVFTLVAGLGTCLIFGMAPALVSTRVEAAGVLKDGGRSSSGASRQAFRKMLVTAQIALSMMLLVGAGLLIQTLQRLQSQDLGFRIDHLVQGRLYLPPAQYPTPESIDEFSDRLTERLRALPGVRAVSVTQIYPPSDRWRMMFSIEGKPISRIEDIPSTVFGAVDANYLETAGIPIVEGRDFSQSDREKTLPVAIVNQAFVKKFFAGENPIGRRIEVGAPPRLLPDDEWMGSERVMVTIAGVMRDNRDQGLAVPVAPQLIGLFRQMPPPVNSGFKDLLVRSNVAPQVLAPSIERQLHALDPRIPLPAVETMSEYLGDLTAVQRFTSLILSGFAGMGLMLALMGVYGVAAYLVAQRAREIGIRLALGSPRGAVVWLVSSQGLRMAFAGVAVGLLGTVLAARSMASLLYGISPLDPVTLASASIALIAVAFAACALPARRAATIDPMQALRTE